MPNRPHHDLAPLLGILSATTVFLTAAPDPIKISPEINRRELASENTPRPHPIAHESPAQRDARMAWWREARFGMFIHWGLYAVPAGEWNDQPVDGIGEWIMNRAEIPVADYAKLANQFNPTRFNADTWAALAKDAGMKYLIITAKHHDGFALFPSNASDFDIRDATPFQRDPLAELSDACRKHGLKLGFYYSQSQDWHHKGGAGNHWDPGQHGDYDAYLDSVAVPQVRELLTRYGPVAVLWYDTPRFMTEDRARKFQPLHALQPGLVVNNRLRSMNPLDGSTTGDTETPEQFIPPNGYPGKDWETCMTMNDTWGFKTKDHNWKSSDDLIRKLSDIASKGGNFLLNVGPDAAGNIPAPSIERLQAVGAWMHQNGEAIYGTQAGPFTRALPWGRSTRKGNLLFLHVWDWPGDGKLLLPGVSQTPRNGQTETTPAGLLVHLAEKPDDSPVTIIRLEFDKPVTTNQVLPSPAPDGRIHLSVSDAEVAAGDLAGDVVRVRSNWKIQYAFTTGKPGIWRVSAELAPSAYNRIHVSAPGPFGRSIATAVQSWGNGPGDFIVTDLGCIELPSGVHAMEFTSELEDPRPLQLRRVWLTPLN